jgi:hypothetical protein
MLPVVQCNREKIKCFGNFVGSLLLLLMIFMNESIIVIKNGKEASKINKPMKVYLFMVKSSKQTG